ncbi:hypothetical protein DITRI_Ditri13aG0131200 [Diplodiscus trichospermus]
MQPKIDLRYILPPLLNFILSMFLTSQSGPLSAAFFFDESLSTSKFALLLGSLFLMLLFLFFSFELPVTCHPIIVEGRGFSIALLLSLMASISFLVRSSGLPFHSSSSQFLCTPKSLIYLYAFSATLLAPFNPFPPFPFS